MTEPRAARLERLDRDFEQARRSWSSPGDVAPLVAPSLLSADFARLGDECASVLSAGASWLHIDVMDGHFVPNLTMGPPIAASLGLSQLLPLDCHLMVSKPGSLIEAFSTAGADLITVHIETLGSQPEDTINAIRSCGLRVGLTLRPSTPLSTIQPLLNRVDLVLVMTVEPGFSGQAFMPQPAGRVRELWQLRQKHGYEYLIQADGGINAQTVGQVALADVLVCGNAVFKSTSYTKAINEIKERALASRRLEKL